MEAKEAFARGAMECLISWRYGLIIAGSAGSILCWLDILLWKTFFGGNKILFAIGIITACLGLCGRALACKKKCQELELENIPFNPARPIVKLQQDSCDAKMHSIIFLAAAILCLGFCVLMPGWRDTVGESGRFSLLLSALFYYIEGSFKKDIQYCLGNYD